ncbi:MAG: hemolysin family protein [Ferrimicrobium sp.]|uniref:hemolysin family protein n=1 Tax=Ferrimicrobium sp. TaxID=2926050 RepID=UPI00260D938D|nr:hemolysin family protein [Ferrimicrobium sp.]
MNTEDTWSLVVVIFLVLLSAVMSLAETSLTRTSKIRALGLVEQERRGAKRLAAMVEDPGSYLSTVLFVTLVAQLVAATLVGIIADHLFGPLGVVVATIVEVLVIFVLGEAVPKNIAVVRPDESALFAAPLVSVLVKFWPIKVIASGVARLSRLLTPGRGSITSFVSEQELLAMADAAEEGDVIEDEERALIHSVINFGDTITREVMVPRPDIVAVEATATIDEAIAVIVKVGRSRLPVYDGSIDNVVGILLAKDLLAIERKDTGHEAVRRHMRPAHFVPESKPVADLLREMKLEKFHISVVVDEYGSTAGLVTLEDLIEELIGDISDEFDTEDEAVVAGADGGIQVKGTHAIDDIEELLHVTLPEGGWDTVGGFIVGQLGHLPAAGEEVEVAGYRFRVLHVTGHRVATVTIVPLADPDRTGEAN